LKLDTLVMIQTKFGFHWSSTFRGEDFWKSLRRTTTPPSVVSGYGKQSINLNKVVANVQKHIFLSQTDLTRTGIISNSYNEMFEA
jgi:hypothetical protein